MEVELRVLGQVEALVDGTPVDLGPARQRCVLAVLLVEADRPVATGQVIDRVWGGQPPRRARQLVSNYLSLLRRLLADADLAGEVVVERRGEGYVVLVDPDRVDLHRFRRLVARARAETDPARALELLEQAAALWRGEPLAGLDTPWITGVRQGLERERFAADTHRIDLALQLGRHTTLLPELTDRATTHPLDERVTAQLMLALYRCGRQADALDHYQRLRTRLVDELGADPGPDLQQLHQRILAADPALTAPAAQVGHAPVVPRQLPAAPALFTGRVPELAELDRTLTSTVPNGEGVFAESDAEIRDPLAGTVVISAIGGAGGIGKTWLALTWAHRRADQFPDGQLFVDLRGFSPTGQPTNPADALRGFLTALGADPGSLPSDLDALTARYRSQVADRRMLVVLDNAATADQVTPLLPGGTSCTVLVTSRTRLASLIDRHGARHLHLDVLTDAEARALLITRLGTDRVTAEPNATDELLELCGRHPLALAIAARHAATRPQVPLTEVAAELRELGLEMLDHDHDTDPAASLPTVLSWSLHRLTDQQRVVFALLGIAPGPDTTLPAAANLTGLTPAHAHKTLSALENASLLERRPGGRYTMHDLIRAYAATTAHDLPEHLREAALTRVMDFHLHTAFAAERLLHPHRDPIHLDPPAPGVHPQPLPDYPAALAWLDVHHPHLLAVQHTAAAHHRHQVVWQLAWSLTTFHYLRGHHHDQLVVWQAAAHAAEHLPDPTTRILTQRHLGLGHTEAGLYEQATDHLHQALTLTEHHHNPTQQAHTHHDLVRVWMRRGDDRQALEHARHALALYHDQPRWQARALNAVGWLTARLGEFDTAREHCRAALTLHRRHHDVHGEAGTLDSLGYLEHQAGRHRQAVDCYQQALTLLRDLGHTTAVADSLDRVGHSHAALGHHHQARAAWREALELYREQGRDTDADRVQHQLDDLDPTPEQTDPSGATRNTENEQSRG
ncbi:AfsR/SARP family transcriptional regulator [Saccharothrix syringae]|uniref:Tetratricopeptide repeat protein n=1 Tax=Saccharothrix syringae TaxID=103733 RepID=A0A5Q0H1J5_SACSY|nr:BTAD domain-containing putative transcriptional regulator [Saccharothrix syringae]QFZ20111.1 tetratricopeptide repeat protein [Saccharothrix syringae]